MFGRVRVWPDLCARRALRRESRCSRRRGFETGLLAGLRLASTAAPGKVLMPTAERYESPAAPRVTLSLCASNERGYRCGYAQSHRLSVAHNGPRACCGPASGVRRAPHRGASLRLRLPEQVCLISSSNSTATSSIRRSGDPRLWPSSASQTAMGGHCSVNGTPTRKPSAQPLPPEIERRDRER